MVIKCNRLRVRLVWWMQRLFMRGRQKRFPKKEGGWGVGGCGAGGYLGDRIKKGAEGGHSLGEQLKIPRKFPNSS